MNCDFHLWSLLGGVAVGDAGAGEDAWPFRTVEDEGGHPAWVPFRNPRASCAFCVDALHAAAAEVADRPTPMSDSLSLQPAADQQKLR